VSREANYWRRHAIARAEERHGVALSIPEYEALNLTIVRAEAQFVKRQSYSKTHWLVEVGGGRKIPALYSKKLHMILTFPEVEI